MYCPNCGRENPPSSAFCAYCGAALVAAAPGREQPQAAGPAGNVFPPLEGAPAQPYYQGFGASVPPGPPPPPPSEGVGAAYGGGTAGFPPGQPAYQPPLLPPKKKSILPWILAVLGVVVIAVVLVLVFLVFGGGRSEAGDVEEVARNFYRSIEKKDVDLFFNLLEPSYREELEDALGEDLKTLFKEFFFSMFPEDLKVDIRKMETTIEGDKATVRVTDGTVTYTDENGQKVTEEAAESEVESMELVKVEGQWYLSGDMLRDYGLDPEVLKDLLSKKKGGGELPEESGETEEGTGGTTGTEEKPGTGAEDLAELEAIMLQYVKANSVPGLTFIIESLAVNDSQAVGIATCITQGYESFPVIARKGAAGWYGEDMGTGIDVPSWFQAELADIYRVMNDYIRKNYDAEVKRLSVANVWIWGEEAAGQVLNINGELVAWVTASKGPSGWYVTAYGDQEILPEWCRKKLYYLME